MLCGFVLVACLLSRPGKCGDTVFQTRAVWVASDQIATREKADEVVRRSVATNLNVLIPQVFCYDHAFFKSSYAPLPPGLEPGYDPLGYLIEKAHAAGLEVHPWFCVVKAGPQLLEQHPEWKIVPPEQGHIPATQINAGGDLFGNVHHAGFRDFVVAMMAECVQNYAVDGLHYDYIRAGETSFDHASQAEFQALFGRSIYDATAQELHAWHGAAVDGIVERATARARGIKPGIIVSAAVFSNVPYVWPQGQDAVKWANNDWVDVIFTMDYEMSAFMVRMNEEQYFVGRVAREKHGVGLATYMEDPVQKYTSRPPQIVMEQMKVLRSLDIRHVVFFRHAFNSPEIIDALGRGPFRHKALPYWKRGNAVNEDG